MGYCLCPAVGDTSLDTRVSAVRAAQARCSNWVGVGEEEEGEKKHRGRGTDGEPNHLELLDTERKKTKGGMGGRHAANPRQHSFSGRGSARSSGRRRTRCRNKLTRAQYLDEVTWTTKNWLGLQKQRISVVLHTAIAEQIVNELACGEGGRVHGAKCLAVLAGVA